MLWMMLGVVFAAEGWWSPITADLAKVKVGQELADALDAQKAGRTAEQIGKLEVAKQVAFALDSVAPVTDEARRALLDQLLADDPVETAESLLARVQRGPGPLPGDLVTQLAMRGEAERRAYLTDLRTEFVEAASVEALDRMNLAGLPLEMVERTSVLLDQPAPVSLSPDYPSLASWLATLEPGKRLDRLQALRMSVGPEDRSKIDSALQVANLLDQAPAVSPQDTSQVFLQALSGDTAIEDLMKDLENPTAKAASEPQAPATPVDAKSTVTVQVTTDRPGTTFSAAKATKKEVKGMGLAKLTEHCTTPCSAELEPGLNQLFVGGDGMAWARLELDLRQGPPVTVKSRPRALSLVIARAIVTGVGLGTIVGGMQSGLKSCTGGNVEQGCRQSQALDRGFMAGGGALVLVSLPWYTQGKSKLTLVPNVGKTFPTPSIMEDTTSQPIQQSVPSDSADESPSAVPPREAAPPPDDGRTLDLKVSLARGADGADAAQALDKALRTKRNALLECYDGGGGSTTATLKLTREGGVSKVEVSGSGVDCVTRVLNGISTETVAWSTKLMVTLEAQQDE